MIFFMFGREAGGFNNTKNRDPRDKSTEQGWASDLARREQEAWQTILGTRVEVKPLPDIVTPEVTRGLERFGFGLRYVPALGLGNISSLRERGVDKYLADLQLKYPNWKSFESLSDRHHSIPRNLKIWFWKIVNDGDVDFPVLPGQWMAVETVDKPSYVEKYVRTPLAPRLGFLNDRFNACWDDAHSAIEREKPIILSNIGVSRQSGDVRLLEAIEWNLLANREGWGKTNTPEWTNTEYRGFGISHRLIVGNSDDGGAAAVGHVHPGYSGDLVGFRAAVVLGS
jgi:hypothetical protein